MRAAGVVTLIAIFALPALLVARLDDRDERVNVVGANPYHDATNRFSINLADGFHVAPKPLAPWLHSPYDVLNVATVALEPSPLPSNQAACPSEIPKVIANGIGSDGASLTIREWRPGEGIYVAEARPLKSEDLSWTAGCTLPSGMSNFGATFRDQGRDFSVQIVLGSNAQARRTDLEAMLDSFRLDLPDGWVVHRDEVKGVAAVVPPGWKVATESMTPSLTDPLEVLTLGTGTLVADENACSHVPVGPMKGLGPADVMVWVARRIATVPGSSTRPATLGPTDGVGESDLASCLAPGERSRLFQRWIPFIDHHNQVYVAVTMGPDVTSERETEVWAVVNSLRFEAR